MNGSSREPKREVVRRTPLATARTRPCSRVSSVTIRSASPACGCAARPPRLGREARSDCATWLGARLGHAPVRRRPLFGSAQQRSAKPAAIRLSRSGAKRHSRMFLALTNVAFGQLLGQHRGVRGRVDRVRGVPHHQGGRGDGPASLGRRRDPPEEQAVDDRRHRVGALVEGVEDDPGPERHDAARDRPGAQPRAPGDRERAGSGPRTAAARRRGCPASTALSSTGISMISPRTRSGAMSATSRQTLAPREVPPITACSAPRWSSRATTCSREGGHRVDAAGRPGGRSGRARAGRA